jgi:nascent polypeptide-associated complex subunit alpha
MIPGLGGMNPKKMQAMMKQLGINQEEIDSERVIIEKKDGGKIVIEDPGVVKVKMKGQESFQITGEAREESGAVEFGDEDVKIVMEKTGKNEEEVKKVLGETGDLAEAIVKLSE